MAEHIAAKQENASWRKGIWQSMSDSLEVTGAKLRGDPGNEIEVAVIKATRADEEVPKEKHVRTLKLACSASASRDQVSLVTHYMSARMESNKDSWVVTLKCLIVFHRLMREVDNSFQDHLSKWMIKTGQRKMIRLESFADQTTKDTWDYSAWIRVYSVYLDDRLEMFRTMGFDPENDAPGVSVAASLKTCPTDVLLERLPVAHKLLSRLIACVPQGKSTSNDIVLFSCTVVMREVKGIYRLVCEGMMNLADKFFEMNRNDAVKSLEIYRDNMALNERLNSFFTQINGISTLKGSVTFPTLQSLPADFGTSMEEYIKDAPKEMDASSIIKPSVVTLGVLKIGGPAPDAASTSAPPPPPPAPVAAPAAVAVAAKANDFDLLGSDFSSLSPPSAPAPVPANPWGAPVPAPPPPAPPGGFGDSAFGAPPPPIPAPAAANPWGAPAPMYPPLGAPPAPAPAANPWPVPVAAPPPPANPFQAPPAYAAPPPLYGQPAPMAHPPSYQPQAPPASNPFGAPAPMQAPPPASNPFGAPAPMQAPPVYGGAVPSPYAQPTPAYGTVAPPPASQLYAAAVIPNNGLSSTNPFGTVSAPAPSAAPQPWSQRNADPLGDLALDLGFAPKPVAQPPPMRPPPSYHPTTQPGAPGHSFI